MGIENAAPGWVSLVRCIFGCLLEQRFWPPGKYKWFFGRGSIFKASTGDATRNPIFFWI
jgi:hypothetical protein